MTHSPAAPSGAGDPDFAAPAAAAIAAVIEAGARLFIAQPWRVARVLRGADAMSARELRACLARRRQAGAPADLNLALALAQLAHAAQAPAFAAAWAAWRAGAAGE